VRNFIHPRFLLPVLMGLAIFGQSVRINAQAAANRLVAAHAHAKQIHVKHVLVIGQTRALSTTPFRQRWPPFTNMGKESGLWDTTLRTDTELLTKKGLGKERKESQLF